MDLNIRSSDLLRTVHPDLRQIIIEAASMYTSGFIVTEGVRSLDKQRALFNSRKSMTMNSRHLPHPDDGLSRAVDLAIWIDKDLDKVVDVDELSWKFPLYKDLADVVKRAAKNLGLSVEWGGDWLTFKDGPHFQLPKKEYP